MKKSVALMIVFCLFMIGCSATEKINEKIVPEMEESKGNDVDNSKVESSIAETSQAISTEENGSYFTYNIRRGRRIVYFQRDRARRLLE